MQNINLKLDDLKVIAKNRGIRGYKRMSEERSISSINESRPVKEKNFDGARIEQIKKEFNKLRNRLSNPKIKVISKDFYRIENKKNKRLETFLKQKRVFLK